MGVSYILSSIHTHSSIGHKARPLVYMDNCVLWSVGRPDSLGVPGKRKQQEANDARLLRAAIVNILEEACLPGVTDEEKKRLLSFVVGHVKFLPKTVRWFGSQGWSTVFG